MGNGPSACTGEPLDPKLLQSGLLVNQTFMYDVTAHHTTQKDYSHNRIIKFTQVDRQNEGRLRLNNRHKLHFCLERHFQLVDLLSNASIPTKCRHPCILRIHRSVSDPVTSSMFLLAEPCLPLNFLISSCTATDLLLGARSILAALNFIHSNLSISHNNIRITSIFVGNDTNWKLGGFEFALPFCHMDDTVVELLERLVVDDKEPKEAALVFNQTYPFCYDIFAFARFFTNLVTEYGKNSELFHDFLQVLHKSCMHPQPRARLTPAQLLAHPIFRHPLASSVNFFENYMTYSDAEKVDFFHSFKHKVAQQLPIEVVCQKLIPFCLHNTVFLDPPSQGLIIQLLNPYNDSHQTTASAPEKETHSWLSYTDFKRYVSPLILGKFRVRERHTRIILLERFTGYAHLFETSELRDTVLPEVCLSLFDQHSQLSQLSIRALGELSALLGASQTLNLLRQTELRLTQQGVFPKHASNAHWPRAHIFPEAAPKISRQQRDVPVSEQQRRTNSEKLSLAQLATLSANYEPNSNPLLQQAIMEVEAPKKPQKLSGSAIRLSGRPDSSTNHHAPDQTSTNLVLDAFSVSDTGVESSTQVSMIKNTTNLINLNGHIPASTPVEELVEHISEPVQEANEPNRTLTDTSIDMLRAPLASLRMSDTNNGQQGDETTGNDWDNDWDFDP